MHVADFDFDLPNELIAQDAAERGQSRLLVLPREAGAVEHSGFARLGSFLRAGDLLVLNNTRVFPARLLGHREPSGGAVECFLMRRMEPAPATGSARPAAFDERNISGSADGDIRGGAEEWEALVHPGQKLRPGSRMRFSRDGATLHGEVLARQFHGRRTVRLWCEDGGDIRRAIDRLGHMPLPPYIKRDDRPEDRERYQTVYARVRGSIAAPTAGLHFTDVQLADLRRAGIEITEVTLHVGYGTFKPVRVERVEDHEVDGERFDVSPDAAAALTAARRDRRRIVAVGTTAARTLESLPVRKGGVVDPTSGETRLFIHPGHQFRLVDGLITNFHLPRSSLLMLVSAFGGRERVLAAYGAAVHERYRFYSYGDAMLVI
jgi:S-adenosylmethionine:tRNA ribosyltransferase-isomerase